MLQGKGWLLLGLLSTTASCYAQPQQLNDAKACVDIKSKLERLYCFDNAFMTPLLPDDSKDYDTKDLAQVRVAEWVRATTNEVKRTGETHFLLSHEEDNPNNVWLTATGIGALPPRPILMLSCIDEISRVELVLSEPFDEGSIRVGVNTPARLGQLWLSDDAGLIFRTGRGIPAIHVMKQMLSGDGFTLSSDNAVINDLQFDSKGLKQSIKPLQKACRW